MRVLIQRVFEASVSVEGEPVSRIGPGMLILFCAMRGDEDAKVAPLAAKIAKLRIFGDEAGLMNRSLLDTGGAALVVSQFTLAADTSRGNRPGFSYAAPPDEGRRLYELFVAAMAAQGIEVATGRFGTEMSVALVNSGPTTIWMDV